MATKAKVSERGLLLADGKEADNMNVATGGSYKLVANGKEFVYQYGQNPHLDRFFGIFGFHTKIGNVANTVLNDAKEPGTADDAAAEIEDFLASAGNGVWREASEGSRGPKYDKDTLAEALHGVLQAAGKATTDVAGYLAKLEDKSYYAKVRANTEVMAAYHTAMAEKGKASGQTLDGLA